MRRPPHRGRLNRLPPNALERFGRSLTRRPSVATPDVLARRSIGLFLETQGAVRLPLKVDLPVPSALCQFAECLEHLIGMAVDLDPFPNLRHLALRVDQKR